MSVQRRCFCATPPVLRWNSAYAAPVLLLYSNGDPPILRMFFANAPHVFRRCSTCAPPVLRCCFACASPELRQCSTGILMMLHLLSAFTPSVLYRCSTCDLLILCSYLMDLPRLSVGVLLVLYRFQPMLHWCSINHPPMLLRCLTCATPVVLRYFGSSHLLPPLFAVATPDIRLCSTCFSQMLWWCNATAMPVLPQHPNGATLLTCRCSAKATHALSRCFTGTPTTLH